MLKEEYKKSSLKLISSKEMVLLNKSETPKDINLCGNLYELIKDKKYLTSAELHGSNTLDGKARAVVLNNKITLVNNVIKEWYADTIYFPAEGKVHCSLCNTPNKWVYYIRNRHNDNVLNVGSECVKQFPYIEDVKSVKKSHIDTIRQYERDRRRIEFGELEIDEPNFVSEANEKFVSIDILLPYDLYTSISDTIHGLRYVKTNYIEKGGKFDEVSKRYNGLKNKYSSLWSEALLFYNKNKNKKLICKKYMSEWLKDHHIDIWERVAKNNGMFDSTTLEYAYHNTFVSKFIPEFRKHLNDESLTIVGHNVDSLIFSIQNDNFKQPFRFYAKNRSFMRDIGCNCLLSSKYSFSHKDLQYIYLSRNTETFYQLRNRMWSIMKSVGFDIIKSEHSETYYFKKLLQKSRGKGTTSGVAYKKIFIDVFFEKCTQLLFSENKKIEQYFSKWYDSLMLSNANWLTEKQKDEFESISAKSSYQKQKEFY